jgi:hypothetical protein
MTKKFMEVARDIEAEREKRRCKNFEDLQKLLVGREPHQSNLIPALEHERYPKIPGTSSSGRFDQGNTNSLTDLHCHVFAKPNGRGKQLYAVNMDGTGHDGSSGTRISRKHAKWLRAQGFLIPVSLVLESFDYEAIDKPAFEFLLFPSDGLEDDDAPPSPAVFGHVLTVTVSGDGIDDDSALLQFDFKADDPDKYSGTLVLGAGAAPAYFAAACSIATAAFMFGSKVSVSFVPVPNFNPELRSIALLPKT